MEPSPTAGLAGSRAAGHAGRRGQLFDLNFCAKRKPNKRTGHKKIKKIIMFFFFFPNFIQGGKVPIFGCNLWHPQESVGEVNGRFNSAVGLIAACRESEVPFLVISSDSVLIKVRLYQRFWYDCFFFGLKCSTPVLCFSCYGSQVLHISIEP